ncbi:MAG: hypothetical protein JW829_00015 [Pirellulales bacterium]|nr:hypothetical protein [Pirellulales bacterium]
MPARGVHVTNELDSGEARIPKKMIHLLVPWADDANKEIHVHTTRVSHGITPCKQLSDR